MRSQFSSIVAALAILAVAFAPRAGIALAAPSTSTSSAADSSESGATIATTGDGHWISVNPVLELPQQCIGPLALDPRCNASGAAASSDSSDSSSAATRPEASASIDVSAADAGDSWTNPDATSSGDLASSGVSAMSPEVIVVPVPVAIPVQAMGPGYYGYPAAWNGYSPAYTVGGAYGSSGSYGSSMAGYSGGNSLGAVTLSRRASSMLGPMISGSPTGPFAPHLTFPMR